MLWDDNAIRGCGMVVGCLQDRWFYALLVTLRDEPQTPTELLARFQAAREFNMPVFGPYSIYPESITRHLRSLTRAGLTEARPLKGRRRKYIVSSLGMELLDSLDDVGTYGRTRYLWLVRSTRILRHADPDAPLPIRNPGDTDKMAEERRTRWTTALLLGTVLAPKWTFSVLAALTRSPLRFYRIGAVVNAAIAASPDVATGHLVDSTLAARLEALQQIGLVVRIPSDVDRRTVYALTEHGRALMVALAPVAAFGMARDAEMAAAYKAM